MKRYLVVSLLVLVNLSAAAVDKIWIGSTDSKPQEGLIREDSIDNVVIRGATGEGTFPQKNVVRVLYDRTPPDFHRAEGLRRSGNFDSAVDAYRAALDADHAELLEQYILYGLGVSLLNIGEDEEAMQVFEGLLKKFARSKFLVEASEALVQLYLKNGMDERIKGPIRVVEERAPTRAALIRAQVGEKKDPRQAAEWYGRVVNDTGEDEEIHWQAQVGLARIAVEGKKDAREFARRFELATTQIESVPPHILAEFYLYAARNEYSRGRQDAAALDKALNYYVRVFALYDTSNTRPFSAEAAFRAGEIAELVATRDRRPDMKREAQRLLHYCKKHFPDTQWGKDADSRLAR